MIFERGKSRPRKPNRRGHQLGWNSRRLRHRSHQLLPKAYKEINWVLMDVLVYIYFFPAKGSSSRAEEKNDKESPLLAAPTNSTEVFSGIQRESQSTTETLKLRLVPRERPILKTVPPPNLTISKGL